MTLSYTRAACGGWSPLRARAIATIAVAASFCLPPSALEAQGPNPLTLAKATGAIKVDGKPDENAWLVATPFPMRMFTPTAGAAPTDSSVIRLLHDDEYLYAAGWFYTSDENSVRPGLFSRDQMGSEDHFMVILDTQNDNQTGYVFTMSPSGARTDFAVSGDGQGLDRSWNGYWDGAATYGADGWFAEMRIPLSTLRFQAVANRAVMGLILHRYSAQRSEFDTYPSLDPTFSGAIFRPSLAGKIALDNVTARSPLYVTPYVMNGLSSTASLPAGATSYQRDEKGAGEIGLDAKIGLKSGLAADITVNTDFAQAEADNQQVNLTRFSLFFPERRQFFLERADLFAVRSGNGDLLFHSRRIGLSEAGEPLRIYGGLRMVGRVGRTDVGLLSMQTRSTLGNLTENDAAVRAQRTLFNPNSYLGVLVTSRTVSGGGSNVLASSDAQLRVFGNDYVTLQAARSFDSELTESDVDATLLRVDWARRSDAGLLYSTSLRRLGRDFEPALGFQSRNDISSGNAFLGYGWLPGPSMPFRGVTATVSGDVFRRNSDNVVDASGQQAALSATLRSAHSGSFDVSRSFERIDQPFTVAGGTVIAPGEYTSLVYSGSVSTSARTRVTASLSGSIGDFYDGERFTLILSPRWNASEHLQVGPDMIWTRLDFADRGYRVAADVARLRIQYAANSRMSATMLSQYSRSTKSVSANVRFRMQFAEGRDLWVVYNDLLDTDRDPPAPGGPRQPLSSARTLLVKYSHTLVR